MNRLKRKRRMTMRKLFLGLFLALGLFVTQSQAQTPFLGCTDVTLSATGRSLLFSNDQGAMVAVSATYYTTGSPASVSITLEGGNQLAATQTPFTVLSAQTNTTGANIGSATDMWRYWYVNLGTLSGGSSPTVVVSWCASDSVATTTSLGAGVTAPSFSGDSLVFEGATADANETTVGVEDPTADRTFTLPNATGTAVVSTANPTAANSFRGVNNGVEFEGATADASETTVTVTDPTGDRTITIPDASGAPMLSTLATNAPDAANSWTGGTNTLVAEGATADGSEGTITPQDFAADRAITLLDAAGGLNVGHILEVIFCGQLPNNTTNYVSPATGYAAAPAYDFGAAADSWQLGGDGCDAQDNTTEATADEVMYANNAMKVLGFSCTVSGSGSNGVTINLRSAADDLTPDVTMTIPTMETTASAATVTTTDIAAGATVAASAVTTEDLSAQDYWCVGRFLLVP